MAKDPAGIDSSDKATKATPEDLIIQKAETEAAKIIKAAEADAKAIRDSAAAEANLSEAVKSGMAVEEAAKLVHRVVVEPPKEEGGKAKEVKKAIEADEVLNFKDYGDHVVVVTKDGQKFTGEK